MNGWCKVLVRGPDTEDGHLGPVEWEAELPLAGMSVEQARGGVNLMGRVQAAGDDGVVALAGMGLVPDPQAYRDRIIAAVQGVPIPRFVLKTEPDLPCYVNLLQMAAIVGRSKRTLEKIVKDLPLPDVDGGGGFANFWDWEKVRPVLQDRYGRMLPEHFPADRIPRRES